MCNPILTRSQEGTLGHPFPTQFRPPLSPVPAQALHVPARATGMEISTCTGWLLPQRRWLGRWGGMGRQHRGSGGLLSAPQAMPGVLFPAPLHTGPCRAVRVCVPAINIDGVDSAQVCLYIQRLGCKHCKYLLCGQQKAVSVIALRLNALWLFYREVGSILHRVGRWEAAG